jgi:hemoglobin
MPSLNERGTGGQLAPLSGWQARRGEGNGLDLAVFKKRTAGCRFAGIRYGVTMTVMPDESIPTLYEWAGGIEALHQLTRAFYQKVPNDTLIGPLFAEMTPDHPERVALFLAEVLGGPAEYSRQRGGHATMVTQHVGRKLTEAQRKRWMDLLLDTADEVGLPTDPEFRSAFVGYIEWGTRLAVINSQADAIPDTNQPMPKWGWGAAKGPYQP